jgi:hypothetical protein
MGALKLGTIGLLAAACLWASSPARADAVGWLTVTSDPPAALRIDGNDVGTTPITHYQLSAAHHDLVFTVPGKHPRKMGVMITEGQEQTLSVNL